MEQMLLLHVAASIRIERCHPAVAVPSSTALPAHPPPLLSSPSSPSPLLSPTETSTPPQPPRPGRGRRPWPRNGCSSTTVTAPWSVYWRSRGSPSTALTDCTGSGLSCRRAEAPGSLSRRSMRTNRADGYVTERRGGGGGGVKGGGSGEGWNWADGYVREGGGQGEMWDGDSGGEKFPSNV